MALHLNKQYILLYKIEKIARESVGWKSVIFLPESKDSTLKQST